jgi:Ricin-type beta-trefoil lectin domain
MFTRVFRESSSRALAALAFEVVAVTAMGGCGLVAEGTEGTDEDVADGVADQVGVVDFVVAEQGLFANRDFFWPDAGTGRTDIQVCWINPNSAPGATGAARAAWRDERRRAVEEAWGRHARINFYGWDGDTPLTAPAACPGNLATGIRIVICSLPTDSRCPALPASQSVVVAQNSDGPVSSVRTNPNHSPSLMVHEIGHSLGLYHAEERPDAPDISTGPCAKQSFPNSNPVFYGAYDKDSIMSYCSPPSGPPWLSTNDVAGIQRAYGRRKTGSLVTPRGNCAAAHHAIGIGDGAFVWDCDEANRDQVWTDNPLTANGDAFSLYMDGVSDSTRFCLAATSASAGAAVKLATCTTSNDWRLEDMLVRGFGGRCLDLQGGSTAIGTPIQVWTCGAFGGSNQKWTRTRAGQIRYATTNRCARIGAAGRLELGACDGNDAAQLFNFSASRIQPKNDAAMCLDVIGPSDAQFTAGQGLLVDGAQVQLFACSGLALNQRWTFSGGLRYDASPGLCLSRGSDANGSGLSLSSCSGTDETQTWDYYH